MIPLPKLIDMSIFLSFDRTYDPYKYCYFWKCPAKEYVLKDISHQFTADGYPDFISLGYWTPEVRDEEEE